MLLTIKPSPRMKRIALYGGSFDPVHRGHLLVAQAAFEELELDRVIFIPAAQSPFKPDHPLTPSGLRLAMLRIALAGRTYAEVDPLEIARGGVSYTIDTVRSLLDRHPNTELHYLIGADHVPHLPKWREAEELARLVEFIVIPRPGEPLVPVPTPFRSRQLRGFPLGVSASQIRDRCRTKRDISLLTPSTVAEFIRTNQLYL